ncbi:MAG: NusG domain II-containing protein [Clostridia bacterium]|jgi:hypothetical protein|nr:NusG domain II-containing protein [Clostridia bacterium]
MSKTDKRLIGGLILFGLLLFFGRGFFFEQPDKPQAVVKVQGETVLTVDLNEGESKTYTVQGSYGPVLVETSGRQVRAAQATCPDQICVHQGWIHSPGQSVICVPNEMVIYLLDKDKEDSDAPDAILR